MKFLLTSLALSIALSPSPVLAQAPDPATSPAPSTQLQLVQVSPNQRPLLNPLDTTKQVQLQLVNCHGWLGLDCLLARLILPASTQVNQRQLQFFNAAGIPVTIQSHAIVAEGSSGYQLTIPQTRAFVSSSANAQNQPVIQPPLSLPANPQTLPADQIVSIPMALDRAAMPPEQYNGAIYLTAASGSSPSLPTPQQQLILPLSLAVRGGPLLPLLVLFLGILLGRLLKYMQERGEPQAKSLEGVYQLQADINNARLDDKEKQSLTDMLAEVKTSVAREKLDVVPAQLQAVRDRLDTLTRLEALEQELNQQATTFPTDVDKLTVQIRKARLYLTQREDAKAKDVLQQIQTDLDALGTRGGEGASVAAVQRSLIAATTATEQIGHSAAIVPGQSSSGFQRFFITLSGVSEQVRAEATYWVVRPLLALVLLIGLSTVGLQSLYVDKGSTFGARPFSDYLALILWGLSADVASRSLSNLSGASTPKD